MVRFPRLKVESNLQQELISVLFSLTVHQSLIERPPVQPMFASGTAQHIRSETSKTIVFVMSNFFVGPVGPLARYVHNAAHWKNQKISGISQ